MKKVMALGLAAALTATALAGCGGGQEKTEDFRSSGSF